MGGAWFYFHCLCREFMENRMLIADFVFLEETL